MINTSKTPTLAETARAEIMAVAETATIEEKRHVDTLIERAKTANFESIVDRLNPAECALLFLYHNPQNRDWRVEGKKSCREYQRRMQTDQWHRNNAAVGFYTDGALEDGQHRFSGAALAGFTLETVIVFGIQREAIVTVDDGATRHGSDHAALAGIENAKAKEGIVRLYSSYIVKTGDKSGALRSEKEIHDAIYGNDPMLNKAIDIGELSLQNIADPVLKVGTASGLSYVLLKSGWPEQRIREKLALFQTGISCEGEKTPYFVAAELIKRARDKSQARDRLGKVKELGVAIYAMIEAERGTKALSSSNMRTAVKKLLPDPTYPGDQDFQEAAD